MFEVSKPVANEASETLNASSKANKQTNEKNLSHVVVQKDKLILKDLVPFVEIKKELASDDEAENKEKNITAVSTADNTAISSAVTANAILPATTAVNIGDTLSINQQETVSKPANMNISAAILSPKLSTEIPISSSLFMGAVVKQEVLSDNEELIAATTLQQQQADVGVAVAEKSITVALRDSVRVVGDTTIQRITTKTTGSSSSNHQTNTFVPLTGSIFSNISQPSSKRSSLRGVPFGPLPASATPAIRAVNNLEQNLTTAAEKQQLQLQQQLQRQNQRARKSFPNRSPPEVSPARSVVVSPSSSPAIVIAAVNSIGDPKRALTKTSMVSIPVDVATNRCTSAIPVPPLTAVTKITPTTTSSAVASAVTSNCLSSSTATVPPTSTTFVNCNGSSSIIVNATTATPITMSAPPPLAGLSYSSFSHATTNTAATLTASISGIPLNNGPPDVPQNNSPPAVANASSTDTHLLGEFVTPSLATAITEVICRGPPRMAPRPNGPLQSDGSTMFPSQAGPVCRTLVENAHKLTDFFISVMEDTMCEMSVGEEPVLQAKITLLTMELERTKQTYEREIAELKRTSDLMLCEMRKSMEIEKTRIATEVRKHCELERLRSVEETKKKQWCSNCGREAQFYCCWNTSYCDYPCQQLHWSRHAASCAQTRPNFNEPIQSCASNQMERHHVSSKSSSMATNTSTHYNNKTVINNKKDKSSVSKSGAAVIANTMSTSLAPTEVLKLPTNTYLRPVPPGNANVRMPYPTTVQPVQRFNIPVSHSFSYQLPRPQTRDCHTRWYNVREIGNS